MAEQAALSFGGLLRQLRAEANLTQEELAEAAQLSPRSVSDLERGISRTARKDTAVLLAGALGLAGPVRELFVAAARGRGPAGDVLAARQGVTPGAFAAAATRTLPHDVASFTGRGAELTRLLGAVDDLAADGGVVGIHAIGGMAGIGKTAFAVHAAHRLADRFPAGQIFLPLHGHTPGQRPVEPGDALASLLLTAGVAAAQIPPGLQARMALWRDRLAGRQLLLVLDDAASSEQVRPLLPGSGGCLVLVTSRRLTALDDARAISLDTLPPDQAAALLVRLAARPGLSPADPVVAEITRLCGYLPLAIGMVARQLHHHPAWSLGRRAAELAAAADRLELMATENLSVAAAFNMSYADLTPGQQRLFRRLGLHPGGDINAYAAAALDGTDLAAARRGLEALYDQYLIAEPAQGRYRLHDLIREHARALAGRLDPDRDRDGAIARLLDYYQHTAARADALIARQTRPALAPAADTIPAAVPDLAGREQALAWARAERASLLACLDHATGSGQHARVIALTAGLAGLLWRDGPWADAITRHTAAIHAARHLGDRLGQANALLPVIQGERGGVIAGALPRILWFWLRRVQDDPFTEEGEASAAVHLAFDHLDLSVESELSNRRCLGLADIDDREDGGAGRKVELPGRRPGRRGNVGEPVQQPVEGGAAVVDGGLLVPGERDHRPHLLQVLLSFEELGLAGVLRGVEVAPGAGHAVRALLEEGVGAVAVAEVVVLPGLAGRRGAGGDGVAVDEDLDGPHIAGEVARVVVGPGQRGGADLRVELGGLRRPVAEPGLQLEQRHRLLGVVELAGDRGPGPVAGDVPADVGGGNAGLAAEHRDDRVIDVGGGDLPGPEGEQQVDELAGAAVGELRLGGADGLPGVEGLAQDRVDRLGERGAGLVGRHVQQAEPRRGPGPAASRR